jgi:hypothetical protein
MQLASARPRKATEGAVALPFGAASTGLVGKSSSSSNQNRGAAIGDSALRSENHKEKSGLEVQLRPGTGRSEAAEQRSRSRSLLKLKSSSAYPTESCTAELQRLGVRRIAGIVRSLTLGFVDFLLTRCA